MRNLVSIGIIAVGSVATVIGWAGSISAYSNEITRGKEFLFALPPRDFQRGIAESSIVILEAIPTSNPAIQIKLLHETGETVLFDGSFSASIEIPVPQEALPAFDEIGVTRRRSIEIIASRPVEVIAYSFFLSPSNIPHVAEDGARVHPESALGSRYVVLGHPHDLTSTGLNGRTGFAIWGVEDGTVVRFVPPCDNLLNGGIAGQEIAIGLNRGEFYRYACDGDLSGVVLQGNRNFGAYTFNFTSVQRTTLPGWDVGGEGFEQLLPEEATATDFLVPPVPQPTTYLVRIAPFSTPAHVRILDDFTEILVDLVPGEYYQYVLQDYSHSVRVLSDAPVSVLKVSNAYKSLDSLTATYGMVVPTPLFAREHRLRSYDFYSHNYVTLIAPADRLREIQLDGVPLGPGAVFRRRVVYPPDFKIEGAVLRITKKGTYTLSADFPFGLYADGVRNDRTNGGYSYTGTMERSVLPASVRIEPETIMLGRRGTVTALVDLPGGVARDDIDPESFRLEKDIPGTLLAVTGQGRCIVKFPARDLRGKVDPGDTVSLRVEASLKGDLRIEGSDTVRILAPATGLLRSPIRPKP